MAELIAAALASPWWALLLGFGIPAFMLRRFERKMDARDAKQEARERNMEKMSLLQVKTSMAAIALGEATARAVQRIPDAHCNGDMKAALGYAQSVKHEEKDFLTVLGIHALYEE